MYMCPYRRRFPGVPRVLLEGEPEHGYLLAGHRVKHASHHELREAGLLVVVHGDHLFFVVVGID